MNAAHVSEEDDPGLEGPDYIALVIEWGDDSEAVTTVSASAPDQRAQGSMVSALSPAPSPMVMKRKLVATLVGALGAIVLATWGLHRLRAVS